MNKANVEVKCTLVSQLRFDFASFRQLQWMSNNSLYENWTSFKGWLSWSPICLRVSVWSCFPALQHCTTTQAKSTCGLLIESDETCLSATKAPFFSNSSSLLSPKFCSLVCSPLSTEMNCKNISRDLDLSMSFSNRSGSPAQIWHGLQSYSIYYKNSILPSTSIWFQV